MHEDGVPSTVEQNWGSRGLVAHARDCRWAYASRTASCRVTVASRAPARAAGNVAGNVATGPDSRVIISGVVSGHFDPRDRESYLSDPRTRKWVVRCVGCQRFGFRADAPAQFFGRAWLEVYIEPLPAEAWRRWSDGAHSRDERSPNGSFRPAGRFLLRQAELASVHDHQPSDLLELLESTVLRPVVRAPGCPTPPSLGGARSDQGRGHRSPPEETQEPVRPGRCRRVRATSGTPRPITGSTYAYLAATSSGTMPGRPSRPSSGSRRGGAPRRARRDPGV